jgi:hypothetical protein
MADLNVTEVDPMEAATTPAQGTAAPTDDPSATSAAAEPQTTPQGFDEDFLKKLDAIDPTSLPQSFAEKFVPKSEFTKKTQALAEDRKRFEAEKAAMFELARRAIADKSTGPVGPSAEDTKRKELLDLAAAGDSQALQQLVQMEAERQVNPIRTQVTLQNAAQAARSNPLAGDAVTEHWQEIIQTMQTDPVIAGLATANNYAAADRVMVALGLEHKVKTLLPQLETAKKEVEALKARLSSYERERTAGLPSTTSRAGTTAGRPTAAEPTDINDIARLAWLESGGTPDTFR